MTNDVEHIQFSGSWSISKASFMSHLLNYNIQINHFDFLDGDILNIFCSFCNLSNPILRISLEPYFSDDIFTCFMFHNCLLHMLCLNINMIGI